jgi:hypothetical protein
LFFAADRPYGLIYGSVLQDRVQEAPAARRSVPALI